MRTRPARIEPGCPYCNADHNPDIVCRLQPESIRFQLPHHSAPAPLAIRVIRNEAGQILAVRRVISG